MAACAPYLQRQLEVLDPALVVTLGRFSLGSFVPGTRISQVHGTIHEVDPTSGARDASVLALYHPAAADRSADVKRESFDDVARAPQALLDARSRRTTHAAGAALASHPSVTAPNPAVDITMF
jgi:DNA polymerase